MTEVQPVTVTILVAASLDCSLEISGYSKHTVLGGSHLFGARAGSAEGLTRASAAVQSVEINSSTVASGLSGSTFNFGVENGAWPLPMPDRRGDARSGC